MSDCFQLEIQVPYDDVDMYGVLYHSKYLVYMERARNKFLESSGYHLAELARQDIRFTINNIQIKYLKPALFYEQLTIGVAIKRFTRTSIIFEQHVYKSRQVICIAEVQVVCINHQLRPKALPQAFLEEYRDR